MNEKMLKAINEQINAELYSAYLYIAMEAFFHSINLKGFANWMRVQALEEQIHAGKFFDYVANRGGRIILKEIRNPQAEWKSPLDVFQAIYAHEQKVTGLINNLVDLALSEKDHASYNMLQFFVAEQVEEEASADAVIQKLKLVGNEGNGLFMIDQELAQRVFVMPAAPAAQ
ncbi:MAG: ferritin [Spirochaetes bacterium]|jgi:ferritin|nr:ferritin [Spirochaetota bacterium]